MVDVWRPAVDAPLPGFGEVHVWRTRLDRDPVAGPQGPLSADEQSRAAAFRNQRDRRRFVASRHALRGILAGYAGRTPVEILFDRRCRFCGAGHGKPVIADAAPDLRFNLSHSEDLGLVAVAQGFEVGVDLELVRPGFEFESIAAQFFSGPERATLAVAEASRRLETFFRLWTRKEAFLKMVGTGLVGAEGLSSVDRASSEARSAAAAGDVSDWSFAPVDPAPGYIGFLCAAQPSLRLTLLEWAPSAAPASPIRIGRQGLAAGGDVP